MITTRMFPSPMPHELSRQIMDIVMGIEAVQLLLPFLQRVSPVAMAIVTLMVRQLAQGLSLQMVDMGIAIEVVEPWLLLCPQHTPPAAMAIEEMQLSSLQTSPMAMAMALMQQAPATITDIIVMTHLLCMDCGIRFLVL
jgi:hypothetical protein